MKNYKKIFYSIIVLPVAFYLSACNVDNKELQTINNELYVSNYINIINEY